MIKILTKNPYIDHVSKAQGQTSLDTFEFLILALLQSFSTMYTPGDICNLEMYIYIDF